VLDRGPKGKTPRGGSVRPGLHRPLASDPPVTWWDPATLKLDVEEPAPLRQQHILEAIHKGSRPPPARKAMRGGRRLETNCSRRRVSRLSGRSG
jgi:hypothetical protein